MAPVRGGGKQKGQGGCRVCGWCGWEGVGAGSGSAGVGCSDAPEELHERQLGRAQLLQREGLARVRLQSERDEPNLADDLP